jgi:hypothetical protein
VGSHKQFGQPSHRSNILPLNPLFPVRFLRFEKIDSIQWRPSIFAAFLQHFFFFPLYLSNILSGLRPLGVNDASSSSLHFRRVSSRVPYPFFAFHRNLFFFFVRHNALGRVTPLNHIHILHLKGNSLICRDGARCLKLKHWH